MATLEMEPNTATNTAASCDVQPFRFNRTLFHRLDEIHIFDPEDRVELIEGRIFKMTPIGKNHAFGVTEINRVFAPLWGKAVLWTQNPIGINEETEPIPDFALIRPEGYGKEDIPGPEDILLIIEVAQTSHAYDKNVKAPLYARAGIREFWLVDTKTRQLTVHTEPSPEGYRNLRLCGTEDQVAPSAFPDFKLRVGDLFKGKS